MMQNSSASKLVDIKRVIHCVQTSENICTQNGSRWLQI